MKRLTHLRLPALLVATALLAMAATAVGVPAIVFVSRQPIPGHPEQVPGLGPYARAAAPGGRLLVRTANGRIREPLPPGRFHDVSDPAVSYDGRQIAFAATVAPDSGWRIWRVGADGRGLTPVTRNVGSRRFDDLDPCWLPDGRICFASTRFAMVAPEGGLAVTNLWVVNGDGAGLMRITTERNGAEEPSVDPKTGRIVYARWWTNRWLASEHDSLGVTLDRGRAVPADTVNLWQAISIRPDGDGLKLAGGDPRTRATTMAYQPLMLTDGSLVGVRAEPLSLGPPHGRPRLQVFRGGFAAARPLGGGDTSICAPAALPDGRLVMSVNLNGKGDYGLWVARPGGGAMSRVVDLPGTLELDAVVLAPRRVPPVIGPPRTVPPDSAPVANVSRLHDDVNTFRFDCLNVFTNGPLDEPFPDGIPMQRGARIRFYATLSRPLAAGGDTVVLVREADVTPWGGVHEDNMPADVPMFEQLVDAQGRVLRSPMAPAHVAGHNFASFGSGTKCVGCHVGHSALFVPISYSRARWINASPSAQIEASSSDPGGPGPRAVADRRTRGVAEEVGWAATGQVGEFLRLRWRWPIEVREMVLYPMPVAGPRGAYPQVLEAELVFSRKGREVERTMLKGPLRPRGTRVQCNGVAVDAIEVRFTRLTGGKSGRPVAGLVELETIAKLVED
ncbi:MAG: hypothetical protein ABIS67_15030 [Candidatus Eisenbacteria bacterium]